MVMMLAVAGFGSATSKAQTKLKIGVSNSFVGSEWRTQMLQNMENVVAELKGKGIDIELVVESKDTDVPGQIQQIQNLVNKGVQAIIINPGDVKGLNATIEETVAGGIPVISIDQAIDAKGVINVVIDQTEWARISARWVAEQMGGKGDLVLIEGFVGHPANEARMAGVKEVLDKYPDIKVVGRDTGKWDQATGQKVMSNFLTSLPNIDAVWTQDGMATGVLTAIKTANPKKWPIVVGEARASYLQLWKEIQKDRADFTSFGVVNPPGVASSGLRVAVELLTGGKIAPEALQGANKNTLFVPIPYIVDKTNFDAQYAAVKDAAPSYTLDGIISQDDAKALIAGKFKVEAPKAAAPAMMPAMAATMAATAAK
jgi:ribose transport system substrate-binding protein